MAKGTLTYRAEVRGPLFARFAPLDIEATVPDKSTELILYCGGGYRSALAADVLQEMGYTNVWSMAGGWKAWKDSGAPVET